MTNRFIAESLSPLIFNAVVSELQKEGYIVEKNKDNEVFLFKNSSAVNKVPLTEVATQKLYLALHKMSSNSLLKRYYFYFKDGSLFDAVGKSVEEAATSCGIGQGALPALDFYSEGLFAIAEFNKFSNTWVFHETKFFEGVN